MVKLKDYCGYEIKVDDNGNFTVDLGDGGTRENKDLSALEEAIDRYCTNLTKEKKSKVPRMKVLLKRYNGYEEAEVTSAQKNSWNKGFDYWVITVKRKQRSKEEKCVILSLSQKNIDSLKEIKDLEKKIDDLKESLEKPDLSDFDKAAS